MKINSFSINVIKVRLPVLHSIHNQIVYSLYVYSGTELSDDDGVQLGKNNSGPSIPYSFRSLGAFRDINYVLVKINRFIVTWFYWYLSLFYGLMMKCIKKILKKCKKKHLRNVKKYLTSLKYF